MSKIELYAAIRRDSRTGMASRGAYPGRLHLGVPVGDLHRQQPRGRPVPDRGSGIGDELAASRALADLAERLAVITNRDISESTAESATPTRSLAIKLLYYEK
ncbi:dsRBD fold-containing protein [Nonomuraea sp. NPDC005983]|uniref:dsRBD fold-containing protein n=1 Tax=Nonomuraea sp. NPDC005983 TaxID=3155595 RepID=UPI0033A0325C